MIIEILFWGVFALVAAAILFAAVSPLVSPKAWARIKPVWGWIQRNLTFVAIAAAALVSFFAAGRASLYRRKQAKHVEKARELKRENIELAEAERDEANAAASKASAVLNKGRAKVKAITDDPSISNSDRLAAINKRLRNPS